MFCTSDFYDYCTSNDVDVIPFDRLPAMAATVRYQGFYSVGVNFSKVQSIRTLRTALMHESGHLRTGALHKVYSPYQIVQQSEYRADADSFQRYLPPEEILHAMENGFCSPCELAEYFDLDESYIKKALHYWTECRGVNFNSMAG